MAVKGADCKYFLFGTGENADIPYFDKFTFREGKITNCYWEESCSSTMSNSYDVYKMTETGPSAAGYEKMATQGECQDSQGEYFNYIAKWNLGDGYLATCQATCDALPGSCIGISVYPTITACYLYGEGMKHSDLVAAEKASPSSGSGGDEWQIHNSMFFSGTLEANPRSVLAAEHNPSQRPTVIRTAAGDPVAHRAGSGVIRRTNERSGYLCYTKTSTFVLTESQLADIVATQLAALTAKVDSIQADVADIADIKTGMKNLNAKWDTFLNASGCPRTKTRFRYRRAGLGP